MSAGHHLQPVTTWVIYDHPRDYPREFVARKWVGNEATPEVICANSVGALRDALQHKGLSRLARHSSDDPIIVETWL
jgi:hypothetical protein